MNISKFFLFSIGFLASVVGCKNSDLSVPNASSTPAKTIAAVSPAKANLAIEGMTCAIGCAKTIEKNLSEMKGVQKAIVNFETKTAIVDYDATIVSPQKLSDKVVASADGKTYSVTKVY